MINPDAGATNRIFLTGRALLAGGTDSLEEVWAALRQDRSLTGSPPTDDWLKDSARLERADAGILARHQLLGLAVTERAWEAAGLPETCNRLRGEGPKIRHPRIGCVSGSSIGGLAAMEDETPHGEASRLPPYAVSRWRGNSLGAAVSLRFGLGACDFSLNAASGTGAQVAFLAGTLLRAGLADVIVAVAADPHLPPILAKAMRSSGSVVQGTLPRPLSAGRTGMNPTEGAACLIFESAQHAIARGAKPLAEWLGGQTACEAKHLLAPDSDAAVLQSLLETCVAAYAPVGPGDHGVDWISLHATGTPRFDNVEVGCLQRVFPTRMPWLSAIKRTTGHALGASGLIEAAILADGLQSGHTPAWPENTDPALGLELVRPVAAPAPPQIAFQIGQGMGGVVVVNAFAAVNPPTPQNRPLKIPGEMGENAH